MRFREISEGLGIGLSHGSRSRRAAKLARRLAALGRCTQGDLQVGCVVGLAREPFPAATQPRVKYGLTVSRKGAEGARARPPERAENMKPPGSPSPYR